MDNPQIEEVGSSRVLQGCLFGSVFLFVILLVSMLILGYARFREATSDDATPPPGAPIGMIESGTGGTFTAPGRFT